ncbi:hypothetical protein B0T14DRAFT_530015 [Immersiella caudata]|uniref:Uncharacterized protein n=1 Tax=Immersiella caudata TaxID=314043 RepID=A0AA39W4D0_9PEZI|nr:hypothetical protein B0T14DRAFT_530015 [Immersiella caudata]
MSSGPHNLHTLSCDILLLVSDYLSSSDLLSLATTHPFLTPYMLHLLRNRDGTRGLSSALLTQAITSRSPRSLTTAIDYNTLPAPALLAYSDLDLVAAAVARDFGWVERLLYDGISPNKLNPAGQTPLSALLRAAIEGRGYRCALGMARLLLRHGAWADMRGATAVVPWEVECPLELMLKLGGRVCRSHETENECVVKLVMAMVQTEGFTLRGIDRGVLERLAERVKGEESGVVREMLRAIGA